ncbi:hypothetical protein GCM10010971_13460 [Silvimonas amylolytica]|uniref:Uncharacterized protein n=1 Tax=Silvimonas amylolytica TaxID=449663 RepID=A0ABQ2PIV2_9NEIS|nr:hypothetical protein GCM10010971_13460 [Silvimonas amylolytica]
MRNGASQFVRGDAHAHAALHDREQGFAFNQQWFESMLQHGYVSRLNGDSWLRAGSLRVWHWFDFDPNQSVIAEMMPCIQITKTDVTNAYV